MKKIFEKCLRSALAVVLAVGLCPTPTLAQESAAITTQAAIVGDAAGGAQALDVSGCPLIARNVPNANGLEGAASQTGDSAYETTEALLPADDTTDGASLLAVQDELRYGDWGYFYYNGANSGQIWVSGYYGTDTAIEPPSEIDGTPVVGFGFSSATSSEKAQYLDQVTTITIPSSVTIISGFAFYRLSNLTTVKFAPESNVQEIANYAFEYSGITSIELPDSVTTIGEGAFAGCANLTSVTLGANVEPFYKSTNVSSGSDSYSYWKHFDPFTGSTNLETINVPADSVNFKVEDGCLLSKDGTTFYRYGPAKTNTTYDVPSTVTEIASQAFIYAPLSQITLPGGLKQISNYAFYGTSITSVVIPDSCETILANAFGYCESLESVVIGNGITDLGNYAGWEVFYHCTKLSSVTLGENVTVIGNSTFAYSAITSIYIPDSVTQINYGAFGGCTKLAEVTGCKNVERIYRLAFMQTAINSFPFGENLRFVSGTAFSGCSSFPNPDYPSYMTKTSSGDYVVYDATVYVAGTDMYDYAYQVLGLVNEERAAAGLGALAMDADLLDAAMQRAAETSIYYSHTRPNGDTCYTACSKMNGENIAAGYGSPSSVMDGWMNSSGHKANILGSGYASVGIGVFYSCGTYYWTQCFGNGAATTITQPADAQAVHGIDISLDTYDPQLYLRDAGDNTLTIWGYNSFRYQKVENTGFTWASSDSNVVSVDQRGSYTVGRGTDDVTIAATNDRLSAKISITPINVTGLEAAIASAEAVERGEYTQDSWDAFQKDLSAAKAVYANASATQAEIDYACEALVAGQESLHAHTWNAGVVTAAPTCTQAGVRSYACTTCGQTRTEDIPALGHDLVHHDAQAPTCTQAGWDAYDACGRCDYTTYKEVPATGHTAATDAAVAPTCTQAGLTEGSHCGTCGEVLVAQRTVPAAGHTAADAVQENIQGATCTQAGSYDSVVYCAACGAELSRSHVDGRPLGHAWDNGVVTKQPTETEEGVRTYTCANDPSHTYTEAIPKLDPSPAPDPSPEPSPDPGPGDIDTAALAAAVSAAQAVARGVYTQASWTTFQTALASAKAQLANPGTQAEVDAAAAALTAAQGALARADAKQFSDVTDPVGQWFYNSVYRAADLGLFSGYTDASGKPTGLFGPMDPLTRGQFAVVLWRYFNPEEAAAYKGQAANTSGMADVASNAYYTAAINWAVETGYIRGFNSTTFGPEEKLSAEMLCVILCRIQNGSGDEASLPSRIADAGQVSTWAREGCAWALENGVLSGYDNDDGTRSLRPGEDIFRGRAATILVNAIDGGVL
ncbi:MAG: leucine-rich repeat protein [Coriobacteriia bacterium]|nr:leucine-rich repeat protein [Coriobacteriia bacterium]